ncbi:hypothetical protein LMG29542_07969 [Paraburkholderia humisilvae]|uniref:Uncharacterized protein n=1 Tax=Paraburkholderia humisilvae TaxID=627669 RepID=A0A6J5F9W1_9BURK|nr:hypothetical protein LMG29542_07969 [Paraburkholderia humisilvae]
MIRIYAIWLATEPTGVADRARAGQASGFAFFFVADILACSPAP